MITKFIEAFNKNLDEALEGKTSWGRNELKLMLAKAIQKTLAEMMG